MVQALLIPPAPPAPEDIATVSSVLQRMVDVVSFRSVVFDALTLMLLIQVASSGKHFVRLQSSK